MLNNDGFSGVSNCYVFKSQLQEYAQKAQLPTPVYETIKEGPSHEPSFRSTVIVNDIRYDSLPGFFNRKAAEQSAAEVALVELAKSCEVNPCISLPVHETGLCKNLLQEYAQKMNYAIPLYKCQKDETPCRVSFFKCTVEIGGIQYIGASAKTKKEAEIKAARTALLAIQSTTSSDKQISNHQLTVIPCKKRGAETTSVPKETAIVPKAKKARFKKKTLKKKLPVERINNTQSQVMGNNNLVAESGSNSDRVGVFPIQVAPYRQLTWGERYFQDRKFVAEPIGKETSGAKSSLAFSIASNYKSERSVEGVDIAQGEIMGNQDLVAKSGSNSDQLDAYPVQIARYGSITLGESYFQDERFVAESNGKDSQTSPLVGNTNSEQSVAADFTQYRGYLSSPVDI